MSKFFMSISSVDVHVPRIGGGFGGKIEYPNKVASAVAVAANALSRYQVNAF